VNVLMIGQYHTLESESLFAQDLVLIFQRSLAVIIVKFYVKINSLCLFFELVDSFICVSEFFPDLHLQLGLIVVVFGFKESILVCVDVRFLQNDLAYFRIFHF